MRKPSFSCLLLLAILAAHVQLNLAAPAPAPSATPEDDTAERIAVKSEKACAQLCNLKDQASRPIFPKVDECNRNCLKEVSKSVSSTSEPTSEAAGFSQFETTPDFLTDIVLKDPLGICFDVCEAFKNRSIPKLCKNSCILRAIYQPAPAPGPTTENEDAQFAADEEPVSADAPAASGSRQMTYGLASVFVFLSMALLI